MHEECEAVGCDSGHAVVHVHFQTKMTKSARIGFAVERGRKEPGKLHNRLPAALHDLTWCPRRYVAAGRRNDKVYTYFEQARYVELRATRAPCFCNAQNAVAVEWAPLCTPHSFPSLFLCNICGARVVHSIVYILEDIAVGNNFLSLFVALAWSTAARLLTAELTTTGGV